MLQTKGKQVMPIIIRKETKTKIIYVKVSNHKTYVAIVRQKNLVLWNVRHMLNKVRNTYGYDHW